ncbi:sigma-70 family RNA polymerase sigma factor [Gimesia algae]|uniref:RNA polymerase sigma factor n=1 Tax=Gimesia algae TaxID=2527971 RepID=A0A517VDM5_9PLAN|nr:sigma-70 family RNA polymerase sigma factor [Gimesia algae]QDT91105.1 RNA polymerase sigma factor [Gimesia algae]
MSNLIPSLNINAREVFTSLIDQERFRIFNYIRTLVPHYSDAEDVYQLVCLTLWKKFAEFDQKRDFFSWACGITFYTVCNHRRSRRNDRHYFSQELIETMAQQREQDLSKYNIRIELLHDCLDGLNSTDQQLLKKSILEKQSIKDIAKTADRALQTLYNRLTFLRRELAECILSKLKSEQQV